MIEAAVVPAVEGLPPLSWVPVPGTAGFDAASGSLTVTAAPGVDWSNDALGGSVQHGAALLGFPAPDAFSLSARVAVDPPRTTFDAGALCLWADSDHWAKLCFEYSPRGEAMVVSVVTNGFSDDCNSTLVVEPWVHLRISRVGPAWAFHSSADGLDWSFVRLFRLDTQAPVHVGFLAQAPMGERCGAHFDSIGYSTQAPANLRDGS